MLVFQKNTNQKIVEKRIFLKQESLQIKYTYMLKCI